MKKILLSASAIAMMAAASSAYAAEEIEIGIEGEWAGGFVFGQQDSDTDNGSAPGANVRSSNFNQISELDFTGETTLDNGIEVGISIQVEGETDDDQIDDSYVWFEHDTYGYLALGGRSGAADVVAMGAPTVVPGAGVNDPDFLGFSAPSGGTDAPDLDDFEVEDTIWNDTPAVRYTTPRVAGFALTLGATTSGGSGDRVTGLTEQDSDDGLRGEGFGVGVQYRGDISGVGVRVGVAYERVLYGNDTNSTNFEDERDLITSGIRLDIGDFRIQGGASLQTTDRETYGTSIAAGSWDEEEKLDIQLGVIYEMDAISFSVEYAYLEETQDNLLSSVEDTAEGSLFGAGIAYDMGAGVSIGAGIYGFDLENEVNEAAANIDDSNENSGWYGVVSTSVEF